MIRPEPSLRAGGCPRRVVICSSGVPHACRGASVVLFYHYIRAIVASGSQVLHVVLASRDEQQAISRYVEEMSSHGAFNAIECELENPLSIGRWSGAVTAAALPATVARAIADFAADAFFSLDIRCAALVRGCIGPAKHVVWLGDLTFDTVWYHNIYDARENPVAYLKLPLTLRRRAGWRRFYQSTLAGANRVIASSISSVDKLAALGIRSEYSPYPWPVESPVAELDAGQRPDKPSFFFFGTLSALGSRSAFRFLLDRLYPQLIALWGSGGFTIYICGLRDMPEWVATALRTRPELIFKGFVDDLNELGRGCHAMLAPIDVPVGNRSRIVTAMAYGWPIIAHTSTALGNPDLVSGRNCLLAADVEQFVEHMKFVVEQPAVALAMGRAAQASYKESFAPPVATARLLDCLRSSTDQISGMS